MSDLDKIGAAMSDLRHAITNAAIPRMNDYEVFEDLLEARRLVRTAQGLVQIHQRMES